MTDDNRDEDLGLDDPDRLPWLETADGYEYEENASPLKVAGLVLAGLALLAAIVGGIYWLQRNQSDGASGNGELIAAQEGDDACHGWPSASTVSVKRWKTASSEGQNRARPCGCGFRPAGCIQ